MIQLYQIARTLMKIWLLSMNVFDLPISNVNWGCSFKMMVFQLQRWPLPFLIILSEDELQRFPQELIDLLEVDVSAYNVDD